MVLKLVMVDPSKSGKDKVRSNTFYHFEIDSTGKPQGQNGDGSIVSGDRKMESTKEGCAPIMFRKFDSGQGSAPSSKVDRESHNTAGQTRISIPETTSVVRQGQGQVNGTNIDRRTPSTTNSDLDLAGENTVVISKCGSSRNDTNKKVKFMFFEPMMKQTGPPEGQRVARKISSAFERRQHTILFSQSKKHSSVKLSSVSQPLRVNKAEFSLSHSAVKQEIPKCPTNSAQKTDPLLSSKLNGGVPPQKLKPCNEIKFKFFRRDPQRSAAKRYVTYTFKVNLKDNNNKQNEGSSSVLK